MKEKEEKIVTVERLAFGGEGVGRVDGKVIFVPWTAPGDRIKVHVLADHETYERGELIEVLAPSPHRIEPACGVFGSCGGCQWQHIDYATQLYWKTEILTETLRRVGRLSDPKVLPILAAEDPWNYRRRIQVKIDFEGNIGFHESKSHRVIPFAECKIADPRLNRRLNEIRQEETKPSAPFELSLNGSEKVYQTEDKKGEIIFSQVNPVQNEKLIATVLDFCFGKSETAFAKKRSVIELYAGSGNFSFPLAEKAGFVYSIEENELAVKQAVDRVKRDNISNLEWIAGHVEWGLKSLYRKKIPSDILVLDPPRRGAKEIIDLVCVMRPKCIVYVSCDPVTLARDINLLTRRYYRLEKVQPIDMFPQTYHIESVSQLVLV